MNKYVPVAGIILIVVLFIMFGGITVVNTGHRGIKTRFGEVVSNSLPEGIYFYNPLTSNITQMDIRVQKYPIKMETYTKDVQQTAVGVVINYALDPEKVHMLYKTVGKDYQGRVIQPQIYNAVKDVIGKWEADALIANRELATSEIQKRLTTELAKYDIIAQAVVLEDISYSKQFERAIEEKQIATQEAIKARNKTKQIEEEAKQKVMSAQAEAESMRIRSQALSQNKSLVEYEAVQKWDGKLPVNMYGSAPIPFINLNK